MHAHHTALPVSVPGRLQFIEACLERFSVHHVVIVRVRLFDGFVNRAENETIQFRTVASASNLLIESRLFHLPTSSSFSRVGGFAG